VSPPRPLHPLVEWTGANVGPLAEIGFTQNHGTSLTQLRGDESVGWRARSEQRQRSRRRIHAVPSIDIVLDEKADAMKRPARPFRLALLVKRIAIWRASGLSSMTELTVGPALSISAIACQVFLGQRAGRILAGLEGFLEIVNCDLVELEILLEVLCNPLVARPRRRRRIGNASRAERGVSSRGKESRSLRCGGTCGARWNSS